MSGEKNYLGNLIVQFLNNFTDSPGHVLRCHSCNQVITWIVQPGLSLLPPSVQMSLNHLPRCSQQSFVQLHSVAASRSRELDPPPVTALLNQK